MRPLRSNKLVQITLRAGGLVAAGFLVAFFVIASSEYSRNHWTPGRNTIDVVVFTVVTFVTVAIQFKNRWPRWSFWVTLCVSLFIHCLAYAAVVRHFHDLPVILFAVIA